MRRYSRGTKRGQSRESQSAFSLTLTLELLLVQRTNAKIRTVLQYVVRYASVWRVEP